MSQQGRQNFYDSETRKLVKILKQADPQKVIRFGSASGGTLHEESDIDLCILLESGEELPRFRRVQRLYGLLIKSDYSWPVDVELRVYSPKEYGERLKKGDPFVREIARGEIVYER